MAVSAPVHPRDRPIAVFDSGVGGLTVLHELLVQLPEEDFVYLADTARFPYGDRTRAELERFSLEIAEELLRHRAKLLVVACNSATAAALPALQARMMQTTLGVDVIGVVRPGGVHAVAATRNGRVGVLATDCVYVGDDLRDMQAARAAGMAAWAAAWGYLGPQASVQAWGADIVLAHPNELLQWLDVA